MSLLNTQNQKQHHHSPNKNKKKRLSQDQIKLLEASFDCNKKLEPERKLQLAGELGVPPRQIAIWYQNKRARWKNQSLELDYSALQVKLEGALADKRELEKEVKHLREELQKARNAFLAQKQASAELYPSVSSLSSCYEGGGSSASLYNDDVSCSWAINGDHHHHQALQPDDQLYYPCFLQGGDGSSRWQNDNVVFGIHTRKS